MFATLYRWKEDLKARWRGERRVAPGMRGRVYERVEQDDGTAFLAGHEANVKLSATVTRAAGGVEHYDIINGVPVRRD